ncbi:MAG: NAD(P)/FAD-dependent oxidoreductase [Verrucomicrobiota bacterium]
MRSQFTREQQTGKLVAKAVRDLAIVGGGPAGATCAAFAAAAGLDVVVLERAKFPREKVCGDCLNPECWPILRRLGLEERVRTSTHAALEAVEFVSLRGKRVVVPLPPKAEIAIKRSILDALLLEKAAAAGSEVQEEVTVTHVRRTNEYWMIKSGTGAEVCARLLVAADGRNSTVARLLGLLHHGSRERVALQAHIPLPPAFGRRVVLQWRPQGYSGQAPVSESELNLCLVGRAKDISELQAWAANAFHLPPAQKWRTITPLARATLAPAQQNLLLAGDVARVVEPFTGEGIYYAMRSGELAAECAQDMLRGEPVAGARHYADAHAALYRGRLWINALTRAAVVSPVIGSSILELARFQPALLRTLTRKIVR